MIGDSDVNEESYLKLIDENTDLREISEEFYRMLDPLPIKEKLDIESIFNKYMVHACKIVYECEKK